MFLKRKIELSILNEDFEKANSSFIFLFGRKGIGKTSLINEYTKDKKTLYLSFVETIEEIYFSNISKFIYNFFNIKANKKLKSFEEFLYFVHHMKIDKKIVIVLDDFNKIKEENIRLFYALWNKHLKNKNIQIIISSSVHKSKKDILNIYSKANENIILNELPFSIISTINKNINKKDLMYVYACFGTNSTFLKQYNEKKDFLLNVKDILLSDNKDVLNYGINLLNDELSDISTYTSILYAIAMGNNKIGEIADFVNLKSSFLTRYIQKLQDLMLIQKHMPINNNPLKSKFGRYEISDNYLKFWFCYIFPHIFLLERNNTYSLLSYIRKDFSKRLVKKAYKKYMLNLVKEHSSKYLDYEPNFIDGWWNNKKEEIDIVAYNAEKITFIDCQWREKDSIEECYENLKNKASLFISPLAKEYMIFSKNSN